MSSRSRVRVHPSSSRHAHARPDGDAFRPNAPRAAWPLTVGLLSVLVGCSDAPAETVTERVAAAPTSQSALVGTDGALTVAAANTVVNQYAVLGANAAVGATSLSVTNIADLTSGAFGALAAGDLILVIQMQGATIDATDTATYGAVTALNGAGNYELIGVAGVSGNVIQLDPTGGGLKNAYTTAGHTQIVRVPQLSSLTVNAGATIVPSSWDGTRGGIVAVHVTGTATIQGALDASGAGFRGGALDNNTNGPGGNITIYRSASSADGAEKGEGIAGFATEYDASYNGRYGRGAPANGGGGGDSHNAGGGGGANASATVATWTGAGRMVVTSTSPLAAWALDPAYIANGNALTTSPGGGRGGYTYSSSNQDATTMGPGNAAWGGDSRREVGGLGGRPLSPAADGRLFFGGGGGAGDANNGAGGAGGRGGGLVLLIADTVSGTGAVRANGANGASTTGTGNDAPGGGGGGGTIVIQASTLSGISAQADGGTGGTQTIASAEAEGPGGGGGGGFVATSGGTIPVTANGGSAGTTSSSAVTEFVANGATGGSAGVTNASAATLVGLVDGTPPDTTITAQPASSTNSTSASFSFTSTDANATYECRVDGGAFSACTSPRTFTGLAEGSHTFDVRAVDPSRNVDPTPATYTWTVDTTPPDTVITAQPPSLTNSSSASFSFASADNTASFECSLDGGAFAPCTTGQSYLGLSDGAHAFAVRAVDPAGNVDATPATYAWTVDTTAPETSITAQPPSLTNSSSASFSFTSPDNTAGFECSLDGGAFAPCTSSQSYVGLADGAHTFAVRAVDTAGNVDGTPATSTWTVDTTPPETSITAQPPLLTNSSAAAFSFTSPDNTATFECSLDGGAFVPCTTGQSYVALADGAHTFAVRAVDAAGNADATPATYAWAVDTTPPDTTITSQPPLLTNVADASFDFTSNDGAATFECSLDGGAFVPCTTGQSIPGLADGSHTFAVRAVDAAGNADPTPASYTWTVDTTPPDTTITSQPPLLTNVADASFDFTSNDGAATFECSLDGGAFAPCTTGQSFPGLTDGSHTFAVRARDAAGNVDPTPATHTWTVDTTPPETTITSAPPTLDNSVDVAFEFTSTGGGTTFECKLDGGAFVPCTTGQSYQGLADGSHTFAVRAVDAAGNADPTPATHTWTIDTSTPDTTITTHPNALTNVADASFAFVSNDGTATFECSLDGAAFGACTTPATYPGLADGDHTFAVRARNLAGTVDPTPASFTFTVDTVAPDTAFATLPPAQITTPTPTFELSSPDGTATFECSLDGAAFAPCPATYTTPPLADGMHDLVVRALDPAGNVDPTPLTFEFEVVTVPLDGGLIDAGADAGEDAGADAGAGDGGDGDAGADAGARRPGGVVGGACGCRAAGAAPAGGGAPWSLGAMVLGLVLARIGRRRSRSS